MSLFDQMKETMGKNLLEEVMESDNKGNLVTSAAEQVLDKVSECAKDEFKARFGGGDEKDDDEKKDDGGGLKLPSFKLGSLFG